MILTPWDRSYYRTKFQRLADDMRREDEREFASCAVLVECGQCDGTGLGRLFSTCISCGGEGRIEEEE